MINVIFGYCTRTGTLYIIIFYYNNFCYNLLNDILYIDPLGCTNKIICD